MLDSPQNKTTRKLAALKVTFEAGLPGRFASIRENFDRATTAKDAKTVRDSLSGINHEAHKLSGSAGIFGFPEISNVAKELEHISTRILELGDIDHPDAQLVEIETHINDLTNMQLSGSASLVNSIVYDQIICQPTPRHSDRKTVLLIDDDPDLAALLKAQLSVFGFDLVWRNTPDDLANLLGGIDPAAVIMDVVFPDDSNAGIDVINELRSENPGDCPVVFLSNRHDIAARLGAHRAGCSD